MSFLQHARRTALIATTATIVGFSYTINKKFVRKKDDPSTYFDSTTSEPAVASLGGGGTATNCEPYQYDRKDMNRISSSKPGTKLIFLGSGSSTGCPKPICAITFPESKELNGKHPMKQLQKDLEEKCNISRIANLGDPRFNKNYRNNPSLLISHRNHDDDIESSDRSGELKNVIIDVGKTFREGALRWLPYHGIYHIDSVVLTHEHADAFFGLDDLRGFQITSRMLSENNVSFIQNVSLPVYLSPQCLEVVKQTFGYLVPKELKTLPLQQGASSEGNTPTIIRHVAALDFQTVHYFEPFYAAGLKMIPLPVKHGEDFICNGYAFSVNGDKGETTNVVYLSDISRMLPETEEFILEKLPPTDILVVDSLLVDQNHSVHYSMGQALQLVKRLSPRKTFLVGMNCDEFPEHDEANIAIRAMDPTVQLAHDGLCIEL